MTPRSPAPAGLHTSATQLPVEGKLPSLEGATGWLNSPPLTTTEPSGKIILVNFWTYTCINWLRQLPYLRAWAEKYADHSLAVIGVHTPEFGFEHNTDNVRRAVHDMRIDYPVAIDNNYAVWTAFDNHYWPALYFADTHGRIRHHHFGEGEYQQSEMVIHQLLVEAGLTDHDHELVSVDAEGPEAPADWATLRSPENYTGYARTQNFASPGGIRPGQPHRYTAPAQLRLNHWALAVTGRWRTKPPGSAPPADRSPTGSRPAISTWSWDRPRRARRSDSGCCSTGSHPARITEPTWTSTAPAPSASSGCTSSSGSTGPSPSAPSRSCSPTPAPRPTHSPSGRGREGQSCADNRRGHGTMNHWPSDCCMFSLSS
jgi:thiol-disulfide isomerase/thioredoxin